MAHHNRTPQSVLDAPELRPRLVWPARRGTFVGNVRRDLVDAKPRVRRRGVIETAFGAFRQIGGRR